MRMCSDGNMCHYKEKWKSILNNLRGSKSPIYSAEEPSPNLILDCIDAFSRISKRFDEIDRKEMEPILKGSHGRPRHHMLHFNYVMRKILEVCGETSFHRDFPLLRTATKIHALDDVWKLICQVTGMPFVRTAVVVTPKCKRRAKT